MRWIFVWNNFDSSI